MLSSLLPNMRDLVRMTRCGLTTSLVGKKKLPCVQREAIKVSAGEESIGLSIAAVIEVQQRRRLGGSCEGRLRALRPLHPFQRALFPHPYIPNDQDRQEDQHLEQSKQSEGFEPHRPGKEKNRFHIEHHKKDGNDR